MKKYLAIGHFRDSKNMTCLAMMNNSMKAFKQDLGGNNFIPWVIITEKKLVKIASLNSFDLFKEVTKLTTNYRKWNDITEYIEQCLDIILEKMKER